MRTASAFDAIAAEAIDAPFYVRVGMITGSLTGSKVAEGAAKLAQVATFAENGLTPSKAVALIVLTRELLDAAPGAFESFSREVQGAAASAADAIFLTDLAVANSDTALATGTDFSDILTDITELLRMVDVGQRSRLFLIVGVSHARRMALESYAEGQSGMTPLGGVFAGLRTIVSDSLPSETILLVDASGLAMASSPIDFRTSSEATLELATSSSMASAPSVTAANVTSLFQTGSVAMLAERSIGFAPLRPNVYASLTGVAWGTQTDSPMAG